MVFQRYRNRLERLERELNTRDGKRLDVTDASYVRAIDPGKRATPTLMVQAVTAYNGRLPTVTLSQYEPTSAYYDGEDITLPAFGELFDAEPGDIVRLTLSKSPMNGDEPKDGA